MKELSRNQPIIKVGQKVIKNIPGLGSIHGEIIKAECFNDKIDIFNIKLTPTNYIEETLLQGLLGYNKKCQCNFWSIKEENEEVISFDNFSYMFTLVI